MKNQTVIITGGSSGIGKALAERFGLEKYNILITGRNGEALDKTVKELKAKGTVASAFCGDVSTEEDNQKMIKAAMEQYGSINILINNAGISMRALFEELDLDVMRKVMDTNFYGTVYATFYCLPQIIQNKGSIIGISSIAGYRGLPARSGYSASKFALNGFLESLRTEMLKKEVHVLTACPGFTHSNIRKRSLKKDGLPQKTSPRDETKMMSAETCANHIYRAFVKRKKTLVLTGEGKLTVFLNKWMPGIMDKLVYNAMAREDQSPLNV